jgi:uncharacterized BrkB/YihY/UPF0761 family membrane protein
MTSTHDQAAPTGAGKTASERRRGPTGGTRERIKAVQLRLVDEAGRVRDRLEDARPRSRTIDSAFRAASHDTETGGGVLAAAVAFRVFLFMLPYVFVVVVAFDLGANLSSQSPAHLAKRSGIGGLMGKALSGSASHLNGFGRFVALAIGVFALIKGGRSLLKTLRTIHGLVWHVRVPRATRPMRQVGVMIALITIVLLANAMITRIPKVIIGERLMLIGAFIVVPFGFWLIMSMLLPHAAGADTKDLLPGAVLFGVGAFAMHLFTIYYVSYSMQKKSDLYGAIGAALTLLLWAYVLGRLMTASAVLNASIWARAHPPQRDHAEIAEQPHTSSGGHVEP